MTYLPFIAVFLLAVSISTSYGGLAFDTANLETLDIISNEGTDEVIILKEGINGTGFTFDSHKPETIIHGIPVPEAIDDIVDFKPKDNDRRLNVRTAPTIFKKWPGGVVPYRMTNHYTGSYRRHIQEAMRTLETNVQSGGRKCVSFRPLNAGERANFITIMPEDGCHSLLGMHGGFQMLSLQIPGCNNVAIIMHELLHALGFIHEQSRPDRDQYLDIKWFNIESDMVNNFEIFKARDVNTFGLPYDYNSIMQYGPFSFAKNGDSPTMVPKGGRIDKHTQMGQRDRMTATDVQRVQRHYQCTVDTSHIADNYADRVFTCDFESQCPQLLQAKTSEVDWRILSGPTPGPNSGPNADHTNAVGHYAFVSARGNYNKKAQLISPNFFKAGKYCLRFSYFMDGRQGGQLRVVFESRAWRRYSQYNPTDSWGSTRLSIDSDSSWKLVFEYTVGRGDRSEFALDDVRLDGNGLCDD